MRNLAVVSLPLVAILAAGCDEASPTVVGPGIALQTQRSTAVHMVPFKTNRYLSQITAVAPEPGCDATGESRVYLSGDGTATHLGVYTITLSFCSRPNGALVDGRGTFVAANGDLLHFTFDGTSSFVPPSSLTFTSFASFAGGSGRFGEASGQAVVTGTVDILTGESEGQWDGMISSVGASEP